jgi:hypothetical protein
MQVYDTTSPPEAGMEHGRHVRTALDQMNGNVLRWDGNTGRAASTPDPDAVRRLFETIGELYRFVEHDTVTGAEELAGFLDDVKRAIVNPGRGREMLAAIARYEAIRDPQARTAVVSPGDGGDEVDG